MNTFLKIFSLIVTVCLVVTIFSSYKNEMKDRYDISPDGSTFVDTKTSDVYILTEIDGPKKYKWLKFDKSGHRSEVKELPR